jgi:HSP20 family protein
MSKERVPVLPASCIYHDREKYTIELELPGSSGEDIDLEMTKSTFCLKSPRNDVEYFGCWVLAHEIDPNKAKATFKNGLLTVTAPLAKPFKGTKVKIEH